MPQCLWSSVPSTADADKSTHRRKKGWLSPTNTDFTAADGSWRIVSHLSHWVGNLTAKTSTVICHHHNKHLIIWFVWMHTQLYTGNAFFNLHPFGANVQNVIKVRQMWIIEFVQLCFLELGRLKHPFRYGTSGFKEFFTIFRPINQRLVYRTTSPSRIYSQ